MPNRITEDKANAIATEYILTNGDKIQTLLNCGYSNSYAGSSKRNKVFDNSLIKGKIQQKQNKTAIKADITRDYCIKHLQDIAIAEETSKRDKISAFSLIADMCGFKKELAPNEEKERKRLLRMSLEEKKMAEKMAISRMTEESKEQVAAAIVDGYNAGKDKGNETA